MFVGALASEDPDPDRIPVPIIINDSVDDSTYSGETIPIDPIDQESVDED